MTNDSDFIIRKKQQIIQHLTLLKQKCLLNVHFGESESFLTTLLDIDTEKERVVLDYGPKEYLNKKLLSADSIRFRGILSGIKIAFVGSNIQSIKYQGQPAFSIALPKDLLWRQRRQFFRVKSPLAKASYLRLTIQDRAPEDVHLYDISLSGFSVLNESSELAEHLTAGSEWQDCPLILENTAEASVSFIIKSVIALNPNKPEKAQKIGCQFTQISPAFESGIQRYIQQIERDLKQKS
ncbi:MAG: flagellar brake protein [Gammaproteobacteria bacterium HGW-Gammaproteobacteria-3]|nr:MAG: flagellar brake protein [Gammaproteobacteria bacterium HGW-Gammaproteobacteria-3]